MLTYIISLLALPLLCVIWIIFQNWLAKQDPDYQGYKAGCGGCTRSCHTDEQDACASNNKEEKTQFVDASSVLSKQKK
ncbi:MAG: hypothetical protein OQL19_05960 [Gammaproteobacteria bacterium]|nr:hypothetical protein [Gammaproteobacteria bacterium]